MIKRTLDIVFSILILSIFFPLIVLSMVFVFLEDRKNPIYSAQRVGRLGKPFMMYKIRSMIVDAETSGVESTSASDPRITGVGRYIRKFKIDELSQFFNVLRGEMSIVGPRPNTINEVDKYSNEEKSLLTVKPGITDIASIVFSNESEILKHSRDPDNDYQKLIRPYKSKLGLVYIEKKNVSIDIIIILSTAIAVVNRKASLIIMSKLLKYLGVNECLVRVAKSGLRVKN